MSHKIHFQIDPMTEVRDRLTAELQERQAAVKEIIIRAEDSIAIDNMLVLVLPDFQPFLIFLFTDQMPENFIFVSKLTMLQLDKLLS